ncbi:hypothetical protein N0V93_010104 [Gnomoniopsis smithogilvyi]|uniref:Uncharacterized protein n=1 Tax=Gnomoniopsis smithogilvyi TaxID=1191159 RepID=A0A9W9CSZ7_9PEZI|nr:hypothetical protein N0V93_010104 [Gnomoniopsis smithogilvyi]
MSIDDIVEIFSGYVPLPNWDPNAFGEHVGPINGDESATQWPPVALDPHMLEEDEFLAPLAPHMRPDDSMLVADPMHRVREHDRFDEFPPDLPVADNIFVAAPMPHAPTRIELSPMNIHWEADKNDESVNIDNSNMDSDSESDSDCTVSGWELDEEFVGLDYNDDSDVEDNATIAPQALMHSNIMDGAISAPGNAWGINDMDLAFLAPYAPRDLGTYNGNVGEILTHESWWRIMAGVAPGTPLPGEVRRGHYAEPIFQPAVSFEADSIAAASQGESEAEDDIYGAPPPRPAALDRPDDSDFDYGRAEVEDGGYRSLEDSDADDEDDDALAGIPPPKEDSEDDDFIPGKKGAPRRKVHGTYSAGARKQARKSRGRARDCAGTALASSRQGVQSTGPKAPVASPHRELPSQVTVGPKTSDPVNPSAAHVSTGSSPEESDEEDISPESVEDRAQLLQNVVTELRGDVKKAEARYEEAANNPRVLTDPRTKKRRKIKLEEMQKNLRQALEKQLRFERRYGLVRSTRGVSVKGTGSKGFPTVASSSTTPSGSSMQNSLQTLQKEVNMWHDTIQGLRRKVAHCQRQVQDVEAHPENFTNRRAGFKQGRITRLENAQHNLSHNLRMLDEERKLLVEERKRVQEVASLRRGQASQHTQQQGPDQQVKTPAVGLQFPATQTSNPRKRKAVEINDDDDKVEEEEERKQVMETIHASSKPRLNPGTPV